MHDMAITNSGMHLECKCRHQKFHAVVLKELFEEHADTLTSLISYLIPNSENKANLIKKKKVVLRLYLPRAKNYAHINIIYLKPK